MAKHLGEVMDVKPTIEAWADIVIEKFLRKAHELGIPDGQLLSSFTNHVIWNADGDLQKIQFAFAYYGKMVDMGVGKGVKATERRTMFIVGQTKRQPKPFFTSVFYKQVEVLNHIISERITERLRLDVSQKITNATSNIKLDI